MTEREKMLNGIPYNALDRELQSLQENAQILLYEYNHLSPKDKLKKSKILKELFGECGDLVFINQDFKCDYGKNIFFKGLAILNYNCVILDNSIVTIGENAFIGPNTIISCASHPILASERNSGITLSKPITLGNNVWLGANCTVLGGVTIGDNSIIGAGSVVTKDIPARVIAVGNPCKVLKEITEEDSILLKNK